MHATLVVLAAGLGSRFKGGIKQLEPLGPSCEITTQSTTQSRLALTRSFSSSAKTSKTLLTR